MKRNPTLRDFLHNEYAPSRLTLSKQGLWQLDLAVRLLDTWHGKPVRASDLSESFIARYLKAASAGYAPATINSKRRSLLTIWRAMADEKLCPDPIMRKVPRAREPKKNPDAWTVEEVEQILARCQALGGTVGNIPRCWWWTAWVLVIYETGIRAGALREVEPVDYDPNEGSLYVRPEIQKNATGQLFWLSSDTVGVVNHIYDPDAPRLFHFPYTRYWLWRYFRREVLRKSGLKPSRMPEGAMDSFHRLRRTNLSYLARVDVRLAVQQAGHCRPEVTRRHYLDDRIVRPKDGERPVDYLPKLSLKPRLGLVRDDGRDD